jgi:diaminopimelate epimerase
LTVADVAAAPVAALGAALERHPAFPNRLNVGFMQIVDAAHIWLRVFERGVGETLACGTGACAAVAVGRKDGRLAANVTVQLPGGELEVRWGGPGEHLWLEGPAVVSFEGEVEVPSSASIPEVTRKS